MENELKIPTQYTEAEFEVMATQNLAMLLVMIAGKNGNAGTLYFDYAGTEVMVAMAPAGKMRGLVSDVLEGKL